MKKLSGYLFVASLMAMLFGCSGESPLSDGSIGIFNPPDPVTISELVITDTPPDQLVGGSVSVNSADVSGNQLTITLSHSGGCVENNYICYMTPAAFLESYPVQANLYIRNNAPFDPCDGIVNATVYYDLSPIEALYHEHYGSVGAIALNIYENVGGIPIVVHRVIYVP